MEILSKILLIAIASLSLSFPMMWLVYFFYGMCEKLVHALQEKRITEKELEKYLWICALIISLALCSYFAFSN